MFVLSYLLCNTPELIWVEPSDVIVSLVATPEPDEFVFNSNEEPPETYGAITAAPASLIDISITPANQSTIRPLRNYILDIDTTTSTSRAVLDFQNTVVSI